MFEYVVVDLETTGLDPYKGSEIIEIGVTELNGNHIGRNFSRLVKPNSSIPKIITEITSITDDMLVDAESIEEVLPRFRKYMEGKIMIAHNAKFDIKFLNFYLEKLGLKKITDYICTIDMLKKSSNYTGINNKLETACKFYDITNEHAHRANSDTMATAQLYLKLKNGK